DEEGAESVLFSLPGSCSFGFPFRLLISVLEVWRNLGIDSVFFCYLWLHKPRCTVPSFSFRGILNEGLEHLLCEYSSVTHYVCVVDERFLVWPACQSDEVPRKGFTLHASVGITVFGELGLFADQSIQSLSIVQND